MQRERKLFPVRITGPGLDRKFEFTQETVIELFDFLTNELCLKPVEPRRNYPSNWFELPANELLNYQDLANETESDK